MDEIIEYFALTPRESYTLVWTDDAPAEPNSETAVEGRVDAVISDLTSGRVLPRTVDRLADAVARSRTNAQVGRAINRDFTR